MYIWKNFLKKTLNYTLKIGRQNYFNTMQTKLPSALIVSLPKSGTVYINEALQKIGLKNKTVSNGYFPIDQLHLDKMRLFAEGGCVASVHIDPSPENMQILGRFMSKWIIHIRDPRSSTLSWLHHTDKLHREGHNDMRYHFTPAPPLEYFNATFNERLEWQIENYLPSAVRWIEKWISVLDHRMLITEFTELRDREVEYIYKISRFIGLETESKALIVPNREKVEHFRTGIVDEWRSVFTNQQVKKCNAIIPNFLMQRFDWAP